MNEVFAGSVLKKLGDKTVALQPYVLSDMTFVLTKKSINRYFGYTGETDWLNDFMHGFSRYGIGATGLLAKLSNPILFKATKKGGFPTIEEGYTVDTLLDVCNFIIFAKKEGFLSVIELKIAAIAESILSWNKKSPLEFQIAELTGLNLLKWKAQQHIIDALSKKQKEPAHVWVLSLSEEFWTFLLDELHTDWKQIIKKPLNAAKFIHGWVFARMPEQTMEQLRYSKPKRSYRSKKGPQKIEMPSLDAYLALLIGMYGISHRNLGILDQLLSKTHPIKRTANFEPEIEEIKLTGFSKQLQEAVGVRQ